MFLFNYSEFKSQLREDEADDHIKELDKYSDAERLEDEPFYKDIQKFNTSILYKVPEELQFDFDYDLLLALVASSFSSGYSFEFPGDGTGLTSEPELLITVSSGEHSVKKKVSELWSFQILNLFSIYLKERIKLYTLSMENESEAGPINKELELRKRKFDMTIRETNMIIKRRKMLVV